MTNPRRVWCVGLTGGIASGKSTVAELFAARGVPVIDTDLIAREVVQPGSEGLGAVVEVFGSGILTAAGRLDRAALGRRIFADEAARRTLEGILHPRIRGRLRDRLGRLRAPYAVAVVPLLVETGMDRDMDAVVVVDLPSGCQRERLMARDGLGPEAAEQRLATQANREQRLAAADYVIDNSRARGALAGQVAELHRQLLARACRAPPDQE
ncbi:dephospho-CoA kinase [Halorhodospira halophila]|uniref:Dephospho-CoA kinase n=1 Tax=Halorhodospira halophila (strain DSM 244 / SL1) TaxID=349124 RepID=A1WYM5_HALHL|nr:dephospho-CoA kinase [Halorhodospira halophila]ABM62787.1 dephospho-CoA kinase [Halorhodospira halophila SL1]MBK1728090.1 dephospho-CoA kinase [Halorhodospira halophila]